MNASFLISVTLYAVVLSVTLMGIVTASAPPMYSIAVAVLSADNLYMIPLSIRTDASYFTNTPLPPLNVFPFSFPTSLNEIVLPSRSLNVILNAPVPIVPILFPKVTDVNPVQLLNAYFPTVYTPFPSVRSLSPVHPSNAYFPISVTESGIVTDVSPVQPLNA